MGPVCTISCVKRSGSDLGMNDLQVIFLKIRSGVPFLDFKENHFRGFRLCPPWCLIDVIVILQAPKDVVTG